MEMNDRHYAAARMRIEGCSNQQIAKDLGVELRTVVKWWTKPEMEDHLKHLRARIDQAFSERMAGAAMVAINALVDTVRQPLNAPDGISPAARLDAAQALLDRVPHTARVSDLSGDGNAGNTMNVLVNGAPVPVAEATPQQLRERAQQLLQGG
jgi:hypothetical protein